MKFRSVNSKDILLEKRFDGSYHNADVNVYDNVLRKHSSYQLSHYCSEIFTSGRNRRVYTTKEFGYPFLSNSDAASADPFACCKFSSKKYGFDAKSVLKGGMILTGRVGAIGQTSFVPSYWEKYTTMGSDNIIRIVVKPEYKNGFLYAYLASKIGYCSFWKHATGGVQPFITDSMVGTLPIPDFPESFQKEVDDLIQESARLREEAAEALEEAHGFIERNFIFANKKQISSVSIKSVLLSHNKRFEATYHTSENRSIYEYIISNCKYIRLGDLCDRIFRPGIFKREYVSKGVTFLGGADILMAIPDSDKRLSFRQVEKMPELKVKKNWILVTCGGTIGNTVIIDKQLEQCVISQHVMRIVPKEDILKGYLFAVLSSKIGNNLISLFTTGSVIPQIEAHHLELVPIPLFNKDIMERIDNIVSSYISKIEVAKENERKAIRMVEEEIEKWNK